MADDRVTIPIDLTVTDIKTGDVNLKDVERSINSRLSGIAKSAGQVLGNIDTSKLNKTLTSSMNSVIDSYQKLSSAQSKVNDAIANAGSSSPEFKKRMQSIQKEIEKTERAWEEFSDLLLESPTLQSGLNKRDMGIDLSKSEADAVKMFDQSADDYQNKMAKLRASMPKPKDFVGTATTAELQKIVTAYHEVYRAVSRVESATRAWNTAKSENQMSDDYASQFKELTALETKLVSLKDKAQKMSTLGASGQAWSSLYYDADLLEKKIDEIAGKLITMLQNGTAFRFGTGDMVQELDALRNKLANVSGAMEELRNSPTNIRTNVMGLLRVVNNFTKSAQKGLANVTSMFKKLGKTSGHASHSTNKSLKKILRNILMLAFGVRSMFFLLRRLRTTFIESFKEMATQIPEVNASISSFITSLHQIKGSIATAFQPIVSAVIPWLNQLIATLNSAMNAIARFFATLSGQGYIYKFTAAQTDYAKSLDKTAGSAKKAQKSLMGFDEINRLNDDAGGGGGGADASTGAWEKEALNGMSSFAKMLKQAWSTSDFTEVGEYLGNGLLKALQVANNIIVTKGFAFALHVGNSVATLLNGIIGTDGLGAQVGETSINALNTVLIGLDKLLKTVDWMNLGQFIADWANSSVKTFNWSLLGETVAGLITAGVNTWWKFVGEFDFSALGKGITNALNSLFNNVLAVDETGLSGAEKLGQAITKTIHGILTTMITAINQTDWSAVGTMIGQVLASIDWGAIAWDFTVLVGSIISAIAEAFANWADASPISASIVAIILSAIASLNVASIIVGLLSKFEPFIRNQDMKMGITEILGFVGKFAKVFAGITAVIAGVSTAFVNFMAMLKNGFSWTNEILMILGIAIAAVGAIILGAPATVAAVVAGIVAAVGTLVVLVKEHWDVIWEFLQNAWAGLVKTVKNVTKTVGDIVKDIGTVIVSAIKILLSTIAGIVASIVLVITSAIAVIVGAISTVVVTIANIITGIVKTITTIITTAFKVVIALFTGNFSSIKSIVQNGLNSVKDIWSNVWERISTATKNIWNGIANTIKGVINGIIGFVNGMIRGVVGGINSIIGVLNKFKVNIPNWVPEFGGKSFGFNLSKINAPQIPKLAQGGVIPPNREFMAILGDQKHGTNIEAPLDTIKQAVAEEIAEYLDAMMTGFEAVVQAINEKDLDVRIGDTAIGKAADRYNKRQALVRGTT